MNSQHLYDWIVGQEDLDEMLWIDRFSFANLIELMEVASSV